MLDSGRVGLSSRDPEVRRVPARRRVVPGQRSGQELGQRSVLSSHVESHTCDSCDDDRDVPGGGYEPGGRAHRGSANKVVELFAGVGGFHLGAPRSWLGRHLGEPVGAIDEDAARRGLLPQSLGDDITRQRGHQHCPRSECRPSPDHDLLVGGFPCQDYSVAKTLSQAPGIEGKKGVLWWSIYQILETPSTVRLPRERRSAVEVTGDAARS